MPIEGKRSDLPLGDLAKIAPGPHMAELARLKNWDNKDETPGYAIKQRFKLTNDEADEVWSVLGSLGFVPINSESRGRLLLDLTDLKRRPK